MTRLALVIIGMCFVVGCGSKKKESPAEAAAGAGSAEVTPTTATPLPIEANSPTRAPTVSLVDRTQIESVLAN